MIRSRLPLALFASLLFVGTVSTAAAQPYERTVRDTVDGAPGTVSVDNHDGSIRVSTWGRDAVAYEARIVSEQSREFVEKTTINADQFNDQFSLESDFEEIEAQWSFGPEIFGYGKSHPDVHYTLTVPRSAAVSIEDHESTIEVSGLAADLTVDTHEGEVQVADQRGTVQVDTHEGSVSVSGVQGNLKVETHEGSVTAEGLRGRLLLDTHEGTADVGIDSLAAVEVDTHEGDVTLTLPSDAGFELATDLDEDAELRGDYEVAPLRDDDNDYSGSIRDGGPLVHLRSHEGTVTLRSR